MFRATNRGRIRTRIDCVYLLLIRYSIVDSIRDTLGYRQHDDVYKNTAFVGGHEADRP